jgi:hypothetical protein
MSLLEPPEEHRARVNGVDFASSPTWPGLVHEFQNGREVHLVENTHFLPMEAPGLVARHVLGKEPRI